MSKSNKTNSLAIADLQPPVEVLAEAEASMVKGGGFNCHEPPIRIPNPRKKPKPKFPIVDDILMMFELE